MIVFTEHTGTGANIPCLQAWTCLEIRNPCLYVRKSVLEILTMFDHFCDIRTSSSINQSIFLEWLK